MSRTEKKKLAKPRHVPSERPGPPGGKRDRNRRKRTRALLDAGLELFLVRGIENVTIDEIAKRAKMAKGSFYRYFKSKEELVDALIEPLMNTASAAFDGCKEALAQARTHDQIVESYSVLGEALAETGFGHVGALQLYLQEARGPDVGARGPVCRLARLISTESIELTIVAHEHGLLRKITPAVSALAVVGAVERLLLATLQDELDVSSTMVIADLIDLVIDGLRVDGTPD